MATMTPSYLASLTRLRSSIFQTAYNPSSIRTGAKYLRRRLRGPSMIKYYPMRLTILEMMKGVSTKTGKENGVVKYNAAGEEEDMRVWDENELQRLRDVEDRKMRGKGAPKKARSKGEGRRASRKR
ncbi:hypothetical protein JAAARDRAFT_68375 [Jaapia argillacea MUCL 33604]|uniref:Small ribosomal subunit protein mS33 n=1 Tax=Jaapia argillacea MUCL 33604 TaxID=933084 RepID=A0A067PYJ9_9AGAM|nr:hypothetical protein JAAARDRAFT_68375 [Jaapia argillacea MUCL 33604]